MERSDAELYRACRRGEARAWEELVRRYTPALYRMAARMLGPGSDAEDAVQETFLRAFRFLDGFDPTRPFLPWLSRIGYHAALQKLGQQKSAPQPAFDETAVERIAEPREAGPERQTQRHETRQLLEELLRRLPAQDRALLSLRYRDGLSDAELAESFDMPAGTIKTRLFRARSKLRRWLAGQDGGH